MDRKVYLKLRDTYDYLFRDWELWNKVSKTPHVKENCDEFLEVVEELIDSIATEQVSHDRGLCSMISSAHTNFRESRFWERRTTG